MDSPARASRRGTSTTRRAGRATRCCGAPIRASPRTCTPRSATRGRVVNVGAGAGSYEPEDRYVTAVEPSAAMRAQRPRHLAPAIDATAERLPFDDDSFDAAMATVTIHQWADLDAGLRELRRVSRGPVVILTFDGDALARLLAGRVRARGDRDRAPPLPRDRARRRRARRRRDGDAGADPDRLRRRLRRGLLRPAGGASSTPTSAPRSRRWALRRRTRSSAASSGCATRSTPARGTRATASCASSPSASARSASSSPSRRRRAPQSTPYQRVAAPPSSSSRSRAAYPAKIASYAA